MLLEGLLYKMLQEGSLLGMLQRWGSLWEVWQCCREEAVLQVHLNRRLYTCDVRKRKLSTQ